MVARRSHRNPRKKMYKISTAEKKNVIETEKWKNADGCEIVDL
jgi:hypothetical protein